MTKVAPSKAGRLHWTKHLIETLSISEAEEMVNISDLIAEKCEEDSCRSSRFAAVAIDGALSKQADSVELSESDDSSDDGSFITAKTSNSMLSGDISAYETPGQWDESESLPIEVHIDGVESTTTSKKSKKKRKSRQRRRSSGKESLGGEGSAADGAWGDLASMKVSRQLSLTNLEDSADNLYGWGERASNMRDSFSTLESSFRGTSPSKMSSSQSPDESWDELFSSSYRSQSESENDEGWLTDLLGETAVNQSGEEASNFLGSPTRGAKKGSFLEQFEENCRQNNNLLGKQAMIQPTQLSSFSSYSELLSYRQKDAETEGAHDGLDVDNNYVRSIRFADEQGLPLHKIHHLGGDGDPMATGRIVLLFLSEEKKKFEFTHIEYCLRDGLTVADLLLQMPTFAASEIFTQTTYHSLHRTLFGGVKLNNGTLLQHCEVDKSEILVPVSDKQNGDALVNSAVPLLQNKVVMRMLRQAKRSGRGIRYVQNRRDFDKSQQQGRRLYADV